MIKVDEAELAALKKRLEEVTEKVAKKALRSATRKAMNIVKNDAKEHAPHDSGLLEENFAISAKVKDSQVTTKVGIKGGGKANPDTPFYFRFQELGTESIPAKPFLRPALEGNAEQVFDTVTQELNKALDKAGERS